MWPITGNIDVHIRGLNRPKIVVLAVKMQRNVHGKQKSHERKGYRFMRNIFTYPVNRILNCVYKMLTRIIFFSD